MEAVADCWHSPRLEQCWPKMVQRWRAWGQFRQVECCTAACPLPSSTCHQLLCRGRQGGKGGVATSWPQPAWLCHLPLERGRRCGGGWVGILHLLTVLRPHSRGGRGQVTWVGQAGPSQQESERERRPHTTGYSSESVLPTWTLRDFKIFMLWLFSYLKIKFFVYSYGSNNGNSPALFAPLALSIYV